MLQSLSKLNLKKGLFYMLSGGFVVSSLGMLGLSWMAHGFWDNQSESIETQEGVLQWESAEDSEWLVSAIQTLIDYVLGFLFIISFVLLIFGGFKMLTAAGDDSKFQEWLKIVKTTAWALLFIFLAWSIVQLIFAALGAVWNSSS